MMDQQLKLYIKGMVCDRCIAVVKSAMDDLGYKHTDVGLGEVTYMQQENKLNLEALAGRLTIFGFSILEDPKQRTLKELKNLVTEVYSGDYDFPEKFRFASLVKTSLNKEYETVRDIFIASENKSLEQFIIEFRINKVKELLLYSSLSLADIAFRLNFTSVPHLSTQFKQVTGLTVSHFRDIKRIKADVIYSHN